MTSRAPWHQRKVATVEAPETIVTDVSQMTVEQLEAAVQLHNRKYWLENDPEISDYEYDHLVEALKAVAPNSPVLIAIGPAGADIADGGTVGDRVEHTRSMLSLDKCYSDEDLLKWFDKFEGDAVVTAKIDGVAASIRYDESGRLSQAATRGNGRFGEDITDNVKRVGRVPLKIPVGPLEVRGELYMPLSIFNSLFAANYANPRNLTAGAIKQKDPGKTAKYKLQFMTYSLESNAEVQPETEVERNSITTRLGFSPVPYTRVDRETAAWTFQTFLKERDGLDYETDGVVYKANQVSEQERLGATSHHPRYALAYKYQGDSGVSTLVDVLWSVSRTGAINPVAIVEPVVLSGASVTRASLHNLSIMETLGGDQGIRLGAKVLMMRRGGVIPHVEKFLEPGVEAIVLPSSCPECDAPTFRDGDILMAEHRPSCAATRLGVLSHFAKVIEAKGFGPKILGQLIAASMVATPADFFDLTVETLATLDRVGEKTAENLVEQIQTRRELPLDTFLCALGISELGRTVSRLVSVDRKTIEGLRIATTEQLAEIKGVGPIIAEKVVTGLEANAGQIDRLLDRVTLTAPVVAATPAEGGPLSESAFLFTGTLASLKRKDAQILVRSLGGQTPSSVSKSLTHLVIGDADLEKFNAGWRSSKLKKAEKLNQDGADIGIIGETAFLALTAPQTS